MLYRGIVVKVIAPDTLAQNGGSEKVGHYIIMRARTIAIDANLLHDLWLKAYKTAIYLGNITLRENLK
jgi:type IV secretory pathway TrbF-like protein